VTGQGLVGPLLIVVLNKPTGSFCDFLLCVGLLQAETFLLKAAMVPFHKRVPIGPLRRADHIVDA
jgi:hypothetical protein